MKRILTIVDDARTLSPCHDAFVLNNRLVERGFESSIIELCNPACSGDGRDLCSSVVPWPRRFNWSGIQQLRRSIRQSSPDEIHVWGTHNNWLVQALASFARCPVRQILETASVRKQSGRASNWRRSLAGMIQPVSRIAGSDGGFLPWFGYSMDSTSDHRESVRKSVRAQLGIPETANLVGTIGPFLPRCGIKDFMWAGDLMRCIRDDVYWLVLGSGPQHWRLKRFASQLEVSDRLQLLDYRDDIMEIVAALDVYVQPSTHCEDFGGLRAAISANVPTVGISNSVHTRLIAHHRTGYLVERGARNEIARCVNRFVSERSVVEEFRANIPAWSSQAFCDVDEAIDRLLASPETSRVRRAG